MIEYIILKLLQLYSTIKIKYFKFSIDNDGLIVV